MKHLKIANTLLFVLLTLLSSCSSILSLKKIPIQEPDPPEKHIVLNDNFYNQLADKVSKARAKRLQEEMAFINTGIVSIENKYYKENNKLYLQDVERFSKNFYPKKLKSFLSRKERAHIDDIQAIYVYILPSSGEQYTEKQIIIVKNHYSCSEIYFNNSISAEENWEVCGPKFANFIDEFSSNQHFSFANKTVVDISTQLFIDKITPVNSSGDIQVESVISLELLLHTKDLIDLLILNKDFDWDSFSYFW